jgi:hypothetical protein
MPSNIIMTDVKNGDRVFTKLGTVTATGTESSLLIHAPRMVDAGGCIFVNIIGSLSAADYPYFAFRHGASGARRQLGYAAQAQTFPRLIPIWYTPQADVDGKTAPKASAVYRSGNTGVIDITIDDNGVVSDYLDIYTYAGKTFEAGTVVEVWGWI